MNATRMDTTPMDPTPLSLSGHGLTLAADAFGDPAAPPVLFLHGGGQSRRSWRGAARHMAQAGYYAVSIDLRGHGDSDWDPQGHYSLEHMARDLETAMQTFDQPVVLVGASRGGQVSLLAGAALPDHTRLVLLADVAPRVNRGEVTHIRRFMQDSLAGFLNVDAAADALARLPGRTRPADARPLARAMRTGEDGRLYWQWDPLVAASEHINPPSEVSAMENAAARILCPVLLVRAEHSSLLTEEGIAAFRKLTPQLEVTMAKGVGHMFTNDQNDVFANALLERLATCPFSEEQNSSIG